MRVEAGSSAFESRIGKFLTFGPKQHQWVTADFSPGLSGAKVAMASPQACPTAHSGRCSWEFQSGRLTHPAFLRGDPNPCIKLLRRLTNVRQHLSLATKTPVW